MPYTRIIYVDVGTATPAELRRVGIAALAKALDRLGWHGSSSISILDTEITRPSATTFWGTRRSMSSWTTWSSAGKVSPEK
jgi:hypothetical protein